jgi:hypothetical protein
MQNPENLAEPSEFSENVTLSLLDPENSARGVEFSGNGRPLVRSF